MFFKTVWLGWLFLSFLALGQNQPDGEVSCVLELIKEHHVARGGPLPHLGHSIRIPFTFPPKDSSRPFSRSFLSLFMAAPSSTIPGGRNLFAMATGNYLQIFSGSGQVLATHQVEQATKKFPIRELAFQYGSNSEGEKKAYVVVAVAQSLIKYELNVDLDSPTYELKEVERKSLPKIISRIRAVNHSFFDKGGKDGMAMGLLVGAQNEFHVIGPNLSDHGFEKGNFYQVPGIETIKAIEFTTIDGKPFPILGGSRRVVGLNLASKNPRRAEMVFDFEESSNQPFELGVNGLALVKHQDKFALVVGIDHVLVSLVPRTTSFLDEGPNLKASWEQSAATVLRYREANDIENMVVSRDENGKLFLEWTAPLEAELVPVISIMRDESGRIMGVNASGRLSVLGWDDEKEQFVR